MQLTPRRALAWSFAERYASLVVGLVSTIALARLLTPAQVGVYSLCAALVAVVTIVRDLGVSEYLIQEKELTSGRTRAALGIALLAAWSVGLALFLGRHAAASYFGNQGVADVLAVLCLNFLILPFTSPAFALMNRDMQFRRIFALQLSCNTTQAIVSVLLAWQGHSFMSLAWGSVANIAAQTLIVLWMRRNVAPVWPSLREARRVLRFGLTYMSSRAVETLNQNLHEPVIAKQFDFASVGLFSRAYGLVDLFEQNVASAVIRVATPAFAADHRAGLPLAGVFARGTAIYTSVSWPFFGFVALMSGDVIRLLFGPQWGPAAPIASVLALSTLPHALFALAPQLLSATGQVRRRLNVALLCSPVHILGIVMASYLDLLAMAAVWGLTYLVMLALYARHLSQVLHAPVKELFSPCWRSAAVTVASLLAQGATLGLCRAAGWPPAVTLAAVLAVGSAGWILASAWFRHPAFDEALRTVKVSKAFSRLIAWQRRA